MIGHTRVHPDSPENDAEILPPYEGDKPTYANQMAEYMLPENVRARRKAEYDRNHWSEKWKERRREIASPEFQALVSRYRELITQLPAKSTQTKALKVGRVLTIHRGPDGIHVDIGAKVLHFEPILSVGGSTTNRTAFLRVGTDRWSPKFFWGLEPIRKDIMGRDAIGLRLFNRAYGKGGGAMLRLWPEPKLSWSF